MVERHSGSKSKVVLIAKSSKEQDGYEGAQDTGPAPDCQPDPIWRPAPLVELAANIELEKSRTVSRVLAIFFGQGICGIASGGGVRLRSRGRGRLRDEGRP